MKMLAILLVVFCCAACSETPTEQEQGILASHCRGIKCNDTLRAQQPNAVTVSIWGPETCWRYVRHEVAVNENEFFFRFYIRRVSKEAICGQAFWEIPTPVIVTFPRPGSYNLHFENTFERYDTTVVVR